jgi:hypothetical protein
MNFYETLAKNVAPVEFQPGETSYFSVPRAGLDPRLFRNGKLIPKVRQSVLGILFNHINSKYQGGEGWSTVWLAGSAVSYQWAAAREPADLDCLMGIDYVRFRQSNEEYTRLSDQEIASMFNEGFREDLHPKTGNFFNSFELTFYVNVQSDILKIKPYAAYSLTSDSWTVTPKLTEEAAGKDWEHKTNKDRDKTLEILNRYSKALTELGSSTSEAAKLNAQAAIKLAVSQGAALFEDIHKGRKYAFSQEGAGYSDFSNYRWQRGKAMGIIPALKRMKEIVDATQKSFEKTTYGAELPSTDVLVRRAVSSRANYPK